MENTSQFLLTLGGILLLGLLTSTIASRTYLPRVTLLLVFGLVIGHDGFDLVPSLFTDNFEIIADMTLLIVGFLLGGKLQRASFRANIGEVLRISLLAALFAALFACGGVFLFGLPFKLALLLGCIASATDPAAVMDVINELKSSDSPFSRRLLAIVALDDIWALLLFGVGMAIVTSMNGHAGDTFFIVSVAWELLGALALGLLIGLPAAYLTGRITPGEPMLLEALGIVFVCGGLAIWLEVSFLIAAMTMGAVIVNTASHHLRPFHAIEGVEWPFMVIFFVLAGASLELGALLEIGVIGLVYIAFRTVGKCIGAMLGSSYRQKPVGEAMWTGAALMPQAGVAIGMALVASNEFPEYRQLLLSITISTTVAFELLGPLFTRMAIKRFSEKRADENIL